MTRTENGVCSNEIWPSPSHTRYLDFYDKQSDKYLCQNFNTNDNSIKTFKANTRVIHKDTKACCCWIVYSENGYKGQKRLIYGDRSNDNTETKVGFHIKSIKRCYDDCKLYQFKNIK